LPYKDTAREFGRIVHKEPPVYPTHQFFFAVPKEIANQARGVIDNLFPYAGILINQPTNYSNFTDNDNVSILKNAKVLSREKISVKQTVILAKSQSATIVRLMNEIEKIQNREVD